MPEVTISVGDELFQFESFSSWVNGASRTWRIHGVRAQDTICIDAAGRVCTKGAEFMRAQKEQTFPVRVYRLVTDERVATPWDPLGEALNSGDGVYRP